MSAPVPRTPERPSVAALTSARERREGSRTGSPSGTGTSAEQALLGLQSSAGNQAATASVQRYRGRTLERTPRTAARPDSDPGARRVPADRERSGSAPGALAARAPRDPGGSGTRKRGRTDADTGPRKRARTDAGTEVRPAGTPVRAATPEATTGAATPAERAATPEITTATGSVPAGLTRRGSDPGARTLPAGRTRRGSESGLPDVAIDPRLLRPTETTTTEERAPEERAPVEPETPVEERAPVEPETPTTERAPEEPETTTERAPEEPVVTPERETGERAEKKSDRLKAIAENTDQAKKVLEPEDALGKGVQAPTAAGYGYEATAAAAAKNDAGNTGASGASETAALKHDAAAAGVSGASVSTLTELFSLVASVSDSLRNLKTSRSERAGAGHHNAKKKAKVKGTDAGVSVASTGANTGAIAKDAVKVQGVANTAAAAEASGILSSIAGGLKSLRALGKAGSAVRRSRNLKKLPDAEVRHAALLEERKARADAAARATSDAYTEVGRLEREGVTGRAPAEWPDEFRNAVAAYEAAATVELQARTDYLTVLRDARVVDSTKNLAKDKQYSRLGKEVVGGFAGEGLKGAAGAVTAASVAAGTLGSNPAGWIIAAVGAGLVLSVAGYKGGRAAYKRFQEAHHPERYTPEGEEMPEAKGTWDSLKHAMKVWKKVSRHKRQLAAHKIYTMVSNPDTEPELRRSAMELLVVIKAGPEQHGWLDPADWERDLMDPANKAKWIKEITDQLASA
ncbi:hypothetical protein ACFZA9_27995 [Streptomyces olivaceus]|uniref:hypothetical protein n=1 Tax=Streptomyces olivaceus TaxID=47716 RepID=UPI0036DFCFD1